MASKPLRIETRRKSTSRCNVIEIKVSPGAGSIVLLDQRLERLDMGHRFSGISLLHRYERPLGVCSPDVLRMRRVSKGSESLLGLVRVTSDQELADGHQPDGIILRSEHHGVE